MKLCKCGCGRMVKKNYCRGHNRKKVSKKVLDKIKKLYLEELLSIKEVAKKLSLGATTVRRHLNKLGVVRTLSEAQKIAALKGKNWMKTKKGRKLHSLKMRGHSFNRIYEYDRCFFSQLDRNKAYILGLIFADGCITKNKIIITLKDGDVIYKISKLIGKKMPIFRNGYFTLTYHSHQMVKDLKRLGVCEKKSSRLKPPKIPSYFIKDFIRGFFDGDGGFSFNKKNRQIVSYFVCSSESFLKWIRINLPVKGGCIIRKKNSKCFELRFGTRDTILLGNFLYKDLDENILFLRRKWTRFLRLRWFYERGNFSWWSRNKVKTSNTGNKQAKS